MMLTPTVPAHWSEAAQQHGHVQGTSPSMVVHAVNCCVSAMRTFTYWTHETNCCAGAPGAGGGPAAAHDGTHCEAGVRLCGRGAAAAAGARGPGGLQVQQPARAPAGCHQRLSAHCSTVYKSNGWRLTSKPASGPQGAAQSLSRSRREYRNQRIGMPARQGCTRRLQAWECIARAACRLARL